MRTWYEIVFTLTSTLEGYPPRFLAWPCPLRQALAWCAYSARRVCAADWARYPLWPPWGFLQPPHRRPKDRPTASTQHQTLLTATCCPLHAPIASVTHTHTHTHTHTNTHTHALRRILPPASTHALPALSDRVKEGKFKQQTAMHISSFLALNRTSSSVLAGMTLLSRSKGVTEDMRRMPMPRSCRCGRHDMTCKAREAFQRTSTSPSIYIYINSLQYCTRGLYIYTYMHVSS